MIARLRGNLVFKSPTEIIIDCAGVGYNCFVSVNTSSQLPEPVNEVILLTVMITREDSITLYGFKTESERDLFKLLISVSGVGPKTAIGILSSITSSDLHSYILTGNILALQKLPGIGKKTAERLNLELKDKILKIHTDGGFELDTGYSLIRQEALAALITLGYSNSIAEKAVKRAIAEFGQTDMTAEILIRKSLQFAIM